MTGIMSVNSTLYLYLLFFLIKNVCCRSSSDFASQRVARGALRELRGDDPNFWPLRGRRYDRSVVPSRDGDHDGSRLLQRGERKSKEEETGVFWAGRGRSADERRAYESEEDNFWANRGRSADQEGEEPRWIWIAKRKPKMKPGPGSYGTIFCLKGGKPYKNQMIYGNVCHIKRKSNKFLRGISRSGSFWPIRGKKSDGLGDGTQAKNAPLRLEESSFLPLRGKKERESWQGGRSNLKPFWPAKGKRPRDQLIAKE